MATKVSYFDDPANVRSSGLGGAPQKKSANMVNATKQTTKRKRLLPSAGCWSQSAFLLFFWVRSFFDFSALEKVSGFHIFAACLTLSLFMQNLFVWTCFSLVVACLFNQRSFDFLRFFDFSVFCMCFVCFRFFV